MRTRIVKALLHFLVHNGGKLPYEIHVCPIWERATREFLHGALDLPIAVRSDAALSDCDVQLVASKTNGGQE